MKKLLLSISLTLTICLPTFAINANEISTPKNNTNVKQVVNNVVNPVYSIGYIDVDKILAHYFKYQDLQANQKIALADLNTYIANAQKVINASSTPEEKKQLADKYSKEIQNRKDAFKAKYMPLTNTLRNNIKLAIKNVANRKKIFAVFKNDNLFFGGIDITNDVISALNK